MSDSVRDCFIVISLLLLMFRHMENYVWVFVIRVIIISSKHIVIRNIRFIPCETISASSSWFSNNVRGTSSESESTSPSTWWSNSQWISITFILHIVIEVSPSTRSLLVVTRSSKGIWITIVISILMCFLMSCEIRRLSESFVTSWVSTYVWFLSSVSPQVSSKVEVQREPLEAKFTFKWFFSRVN